jgi:hypothetical protein
MIPLGYCTIPEAIRVLEHIFGEGEPKALGWLEAGLLDGALQVFTEREREYDVEVCRVPWEDVKGLGAHWGSWIATGVVPYREPPGPTPECKARRDAWYANPIGSPMPRLELVPWTAEQRYSRCQLLLKDADVSRWVDRLKQQLGLDGPPVAKTGAPGRPSSMHMVLTEFERRRASGECGASRQAEAEALETWLKIVHPAAPSLTAKTIRSKLPSDFQPHKAS